MDRFSKSILWGLNLLIAASMLMGGSLASAVEVAADDASVPYLDDNTIDPRYLAAPLPTLPPGQTEIAQAIDQGRGLNFVEVKDVTVVRVLNDDTQGRCHQKWVVALADGQEILSIYNIDVSERIPLKVGDKLNMAGQYIWDRGGGLLHWLHEDPRDRRPDGYVELNGRRYGKFLGEDQGSCAVNKPSPAPGSSPSTGRRPGRA